MGTILRAPDGDVVRASCRGDGRLNLARALDACDDLLSRHGGHAAAAGFELPLERWNAFAERFLAEAAAATPDDGRRPLHVDLALPAWFVDYGLYRDLARLAPCGTGNPEPLVAVLGLTVQRVRAANGGHTQLVLRRERDVLDGIAFGRPDLAEGLAEGDRVDVVARLASRRFGGLETLQLEVRDVSASGAHPRAAEVLARARGQRRRHPRHRRCGRAGRQRSCMTTPPNGARPEPPRRPARDPYGLLPTGMPIAAAVSIIGLLVIAIVTLNLTNGKLPFTPGGGGGGGPQGTDQVPTRTATPSNVVDRAEQPT